MSATQCKYIVSHFSAQFENKAMYDIITLYYNVNIYK